MRRLAGFDSERFGEPMFSIITVTRNDLEGLSATTESVERQSLTDFEHIVIDGASEDGSVSYLSQRTPHARRFLYLSEPDSGIYDAMNKATQIASGMFALYLNAGDVLASPDVLERVAESYKVVKWPWATGKINRYSGDRFTGVSDGSPFRLREFAQGKRWVPHQGAFLPLSEVREIGGYNSELFGVAADQGLMVALASRSMPYSLDLVVSNFQNGGTHTSAGIVRRNLLWHRIRVSVFEWDRKKSVLDLISIAPATAIRVSRHYLGRVGRRTLRGLGVSRGVR